MKFKWLKYIFPVACISLVPIVASSCGVVYTSKVKTLNSSIWSNNGVDNTYGSLPFSSVSIKDAIHGSDFNNGNYIFLYGIVGSEDAGAVANVLYGPNGNDGFGNSIVDAENKLNFGSSPFFTRFYGSSGLGAEDSVLGFDVGFLSFVDFAPYDETASGVNGKSGADSPLAKYSQEEVLNELNSNLDNNDQSYTAETMPDSAKAKIGTYKRNDESAIQYRWLIEYIQIIRPGNSNLTDTGGLLAFKNGKDPQAFSLGDGATLYESLLAYYKAS